MRVGDPITTTVTGLSLEGDGLAAFSGRTLSIAGAYPGERVEARIEHLAKQHPRGGAKLLRVLEPHPLRIASPCPDDVSNGGRCTGCPLGTLGVEGQRALKLQMLRVDFGLGVESIEGGEAYGYRRSSKRVAFRHGPRLGLGSYVRGSHYAADMRHCRVDHPRIVQAAAELADLGTELGIPAFDERTGEGLLRAVWLKTDGEKVLATLVVRAEDPRFAELAKRVARIDGIALSLARPEGNDLRGEKPRMLRGPAELVSELAGERFTVGPLGFLQPNPEIAARAYLDLVGPTRDATERGGLALDLYAGAGVTTRLLRRSFAEVIPCESYAESARALGIEPRTAADFLREFAAATPFRRPELVVANPPRAGMGEEVCALLRRIAAPSLAIMSCHPASLARDLGRLLEGGRYAIVSTRAYDTLPQTAHVEIVVHLALANEA